jgi:hypothetical protein
MTDRKALFKEHGRLAEKIFTEGLSKEEEQRLTEVRAEIDEITMAEIAQGNGTLAEEIRRTMTKRPVLTESSPEFRACKAAGSRLYDQLKNQGFQLTGVGVGVSADRKHPTIHINLHHKPRSPKIPNTFEGFEVDIGVTGTIRPADGWKAPGGK